MTIHVHHYWLFYICQQAVLIIKVCVLKRNKPIIQFNSIQFNDLEFALSTKIKMGPQFANTWCSDTKWSIFALQVAEKEVAISK